MVYCKMPAAIVLACLMTLGSGKTFRGASDFLKRTSAERSLRMELAAKSGAAHERVEEFKQALAGTFAALPKGEHGKLDHQTVRYILHRLFVQRHGWYIKGLEPGGDAFHSAKDPKSFKDWVPSYMVDHLEEQLKH